MRRQARFGKPGRRWRRWLLGRNLWLALAGLAGSILANGGLLRLRLQMRQCLRLRLLQLRALRRGLLPQLRLHVRLQLRALRRGLLPQLWL